MHKSRGASKAHSYALKRRDTSKRVGEEEEDAFAKLGDNPSLEEIQEAVADNAMTELEERVNDVRDSWETDSLFEDVINDQGSEDATWDDDDPDRCSPEEANQLRQMLRTVGPSEFCRRTVDAGLYTTKKLLSAFDIRPPAFLEGAPDHAYISLLALAMSRELTKRVKLSRWNSVDDAAQLLRRSRNIIVITGAGISTSLGIPDFRSKGTGLYSQLEHLGLSDPQEVFDIHTFKEDPTIFFRVAKDILPSTTRYTPTHAFIALLQEQGKLLTNYTQNIDNLETYAGVRADKMVQCHGSFGTATCQVCRFKMQGDKIFPDIRAGKIPRCPKCTQTLAGERNGRGGTKRKRGGAHGASKRRRGGGWSATESDASDSEFDIPTAGIMKPDITFFGEPLPDEFSRRLTEHDRDRVDLVVVIGTSLKVTPVSEIVSVLPPHVPQIYISKTPITHINFDIDLLGDCDVVIAELCRRAGISLKHDMIPDGQRVDIRLEEGYSSRHIFTEAYPGATLAAPAVVLADEKSSTAIVNGVNSLHNGKSTNGITGKVAKVRTVKRNGLNTPE